MVIMILRYLDPIILTIITLATIFVPQLRAYHVALISRWRFFWIEGVLNLLVSWNKLPNCRSVVFDVPPMRASDRLLGHAGNDPAADKLARRNMTGSRCFFVLFVDPDHDYLVMNILK